MRFAVRMIALRAIHALSICFMLTPSLRASAQAVPGAEWTSGGSSATGAGYGLKSGTPLRTVIDFEVPGAVGQYPLRVARTLTTNTAMPSYQPPLSQWVFDFYYAAYWAGAQFHVLYPNGQRVSQYDTFGVADRVVEDGANPLLLLADGGRVEFTKLAGKDIWVSKRIVDPYGLATTITTANEFGPKRVTDASGRYIEFTWSGQGVIKVVSSAGQEVTYDLIDQISFTSPLIASAWYQDGTRAKYKYSQLNESCTANLPLVLDDVRANGPMQYVEYTWRHDSLSANCAVDTAKAKDGSVVSRRRGGGLFDGFMGYWEDLPSGEVSSYFYEHSLLLEKVDFLGRKTKFDYDAKGFLSTITDPAGGKTSFVNTPITGKPKSITYPDGKKVSYTYTGTNNPVHIASKTDERGNVTRYTRFDNNVIKRIDYPDGSSESWSELTPFNQPKVHVLRNGATERFEYDRSGRLLKHFLPSFETNTAFVGYTYYPDGHVWEDRVATERDPLGRVTSYDYDVVGDILPPPRPPVERVFPRSGRGLITKVTYPDGSTRETRYTNYGAKRWDEDELGNRTAYTYDDFQRLKTITDPLGRVTTYDYRHRQALSPYAFTRDLPASIRTPGNTYHTFRYDAEFRLVSKESGGVQDIATTKFAYDPRDNLTRQTDPMGRVTTYEYDARNRLIKQTDPGNRATHFAYDAAGNLIRITNPDQTTLSSTYDAMNRVATKTDEASRVTKYEYTGDNKLLWMIDPSGKHTGYDYDAVGRITQRNSPGVGAGYRIMVTYTYDSAGNVTERRDNRGVVTKYTYDVRNRETRRDYSDATPDVTTTYDVAGRVMSMANSVSTLSYTYDAAGQRTSERQRIADGVDRTVSYAYTPDGNRHSLSTTDLNLKYGHTPRGKLSSVSSRDGTVSVKYTYAKDDQPLTKTFANGASASYSYDSAGRLSTINESTTPDRTYAYDVRNRKVSMNVGGGRFVERYEYSPNSQLTKHLTSFLPQGPATPAVNNTYSFAYDPSGNRTSETSTGAYTSNWANQYTKLKNGGVEETFAYDSIGNMTRRDSLALTYDAESRLLGSSKLRLAYDPLGRPVRLTMYPLSSLFGLSWEAIYDESRLILWFEAAGSMLHRHYWGSFSSEIVCTDRSDGSRNYWHLDAQNSVVATTDASRTPLEAYVYDAYGAVRYLNATGSTWSFRNDSVARPTFLYTGQQWLGTLGAYHYKARAYDPRLGRFLQHEPLHLDAGDTNLYRYVRNNPVNYIDSTGEIIETLWDLTNVAMDAASIARNVATGNWAGAAADAGALIVDAAATVVPGVPGGAGTALKVARAADNAGGAARGVDNVADAVKVSGNAADAARQSDNAATAAAKGARPGEPFTKSGKEQVWKQNADAHGGRNKCDNCGTEVVKPEKHTAGNTPPKNEGHVDHIERRSEGGSGTSENGRVLCRECNLEREKLYK